MKNIICQILFKVFQVFNLKKVKISANKDVFLVLREELYRGCVQSCMLRGSELCWWRKRTCWQFIGLRWEWLDGCVIGSHVIDWDRDYVQLMTLEGRDNVRPSSPLLRVGCIRSRVKSLWTYPRTHPDIFGHLLSLHL